jgi:hypothetical protein
MKEHEILYTNWPFWVVRGQKSGKGFEVYKDGATCAQRVAVIGYEGQVGLNRAKAEADKRAGSVSLHDRGGQ